MPTICKGLPVSRRVIALATGLLLASSAFLAGCGNSSGSESADTESTGGTDYPVTVTNCGMEQSFESAPERVVTIKSTATELLLALGLGDKIVARAFSDGPVPKRWADEAESIPQLSDKAPSQEAVLEEEPDLVYAGWESNLAPETAGDRDTLAKLGVNTYVSPAACKEPKYQPDRMTFDLLFDQFAEMGKIFDVPKKADKLIDKQRKQLASVHKAADGTSALWYSSGSDIPYVGAGIGAPQMMMDTLGLDNIAADVDDTWTSMGWEKIAAENPDVIILVDATWNSAKEKIKRLEDNPVTSKLDAVKQQRYLTIPFPASEAGVRSAGATVDMGKQLADLQDGQ